MDVSMTVYSLPSCVQCKSTYRKLDRNGVQYSIVEMDKDPEALAYAKGLGYEAAPVVVVKQGSQVADHWYGFRPEALDKWGKIIDNQ